MSGLSLTVYTDQTKSEMMADWTQRLAGGLSTMNNEHGFGTVAGFVPMDTDEAFTFYNADRMPHVMLSDGGFRAFEGRLEDTAVTADGLQFTAFGYWRAYSDTLYTELWSDDSIVDFIWMKEESITGDDPITARYVFNKDNEIYMAPRKNEGFRAVDRGMFRYNIPDKSTRQIVRVDFDYDVDLQFTNDWTLTLSSRDSSLGSVVAVWSITAVTGTASVSQTFAANPADVITFELSTAAAGSITYTGSTGGIYARVSNVRIMTTDSTTIDSSEIIEDLITNVSAKNPGQLSTELVLIDDPGVDLTNERYDDMRPASIITKLASLGDSSTPPLVYEAGVWEDRILHYRERGSAGRAWAIDASDLNIKRTVDTLGNAAYAVYNSPDGRNLRTTTATNGESVTAYDLTREVFTSAPATTATNPDTFRDALLNDSATPKPETSVVFSRVSDEYGALYPLYFMRSGDTVTIRNLPPTAGAAVDRIRKFVIHRVDYEPMEDTITVTPEQDFPSLPVLVARNSEGF